MHSVTLVQFKGRKKVILLLSLSFAVCVYDKCTVALISQSSFLHVLFMASYCVIYVFVVSLISQLLGYYQLYITFLHVWSIDEMETETNAQFIMSHTYVNRQTKASTPKLVRWLSEITWTRRIKAPISSSNISPLCFVHMEGVLDITPVRKEVQE